jgi:alpha-glucosidase
MVDGGYDVEDHRDVDPMFGTLADFDALFRDAHAAGLRVIVDLVPNHTSSAHPWFVEALASAPGSAARDRYIFRDEPNDWGSRFGGPAWTQVPDGQWYVHLFDVQQPDLNWEHPEVRAEFESILRFWLDRGVDGFRVDVAHGMTKAEGLPNLAGWDVSHGPATPFFDQDGVHEIYRAWRKILDEYPGDRLAVAEAWVAPAERVARYVRGDELHQAFNFQFLTSSLFADPIRAVIDESLDAYGKVGAPATWVLGNHDTVRPVTRYGSLDLARAAALLLLALPGSAYVYQGEELGLAEVELPVEALRDPVWERSGRTRRGRDGSRVPLPWSGSLPGYGFTSGTPWLPPPAEWVSSSVAAQTGDPSSTLELYRLALRIRREHPALARGGDGLQWLPSPPDVLVFTREPGFTCAINLGTEPATLPSYGDLLCASSTLDGRELPPATAAWWSA